MYRFVLYFNTYKLYQYIIIIELRFVLNCYTIMSKGVSACIDILCAQIYLYIQLNSPLLCIPSLQALVQTQEKLRSFVPELTFNLGFCGAFYNKGTPAEVEGSHELVSVWRGRLLYATECCIEYIGSTPSVLCPYNYCIHALI